MNLGDGKLVACMDAKINQVSAKCKADYAMATASIAERDAAQDSIAEVCSADTARLCPGMVPQDGNLLVPAPGHARGERCLQRRNHQCRLPLSRPAFSELAYGTIAMTSPLTRFALAALLAAAAPVLSPHWPRPPFPTRRSSRGWKA